MPLCRFVTAHMLVSHINTRIVAGYTVEYQVYLCTLIESVMTKVNNYA